MRRLVLCSPIILLLSAVSSVANDSVIAGDKEWLQPADFIGHTASEVAAVCPLPSGLCSGVLSGFDLSGYTWASLSELFDLFNTEYGADPQIPTGEPSYIQFSKDILSDFDPTPRVVGNAQTVGGFARDYSADSDTYSYFSVYLSEYEPDENGVNFNNDVIPDLPLYNTGVWFWRDAPFKVHLEEPVNGQVHSGIGSLRGWAVAEDGIDRVEIWIDGNYAYDAPYGGPRGDVEDKYPDIEGAAQSGFSMAFSYSNLSFGQHTITVRAFDKSGQSKEATSTFDVVTFDKKFISKQDVVDATGAELLSDGDEIYIQNILIDDRNYDLTLKWRTSEQGFEIVEIR